MSLIGRIQTLLQQVLLESGIHLNMSTAPYDSWVSTLKQKFLSINDENRWSSYFDIGKVRVTHDKCMSLSSKIENLRPDKTSSDETKAQSEKAAHFANVLNTGISNNFKDLEAKLLGHQQAEQEADASIVELQIQTADLLIRSPCAGDSYAIQNLARSSGLTRSVHEHLDDAEANLEAIRDNLRETSPEGSNEEDSQGGDRVDIALISRPVNPTEDISEDICPVCLEKFTESDKVVSTVCGHHIHSECLALWSSSANEGRNLCCICRRELFNTRRRRPQHTGLWWILVRLEVNMILNIKELERLIVALDSTPMP
ncbi:hypothetical protein K491DRAFT_721947 [Lophiostoma macrostomum CBS 122681]|uniref:RING-type domain-containing protein n=1 Tax=Lophiostoma macrostomum CBS 122681 TaxID=1314788 RepID=A0A6A6SSG1_9PLEO|nr:hypothetical protein K491DRAFT_721947 [Lophiostoma macrostomum CBS 122681]